MTSDVPRYPDLEGRTAVVTGGSRGIGAQVCRAFAANGMNVVVTGRDKDAIQSVVDGIRADGGTAAGAVADVTDRSAVEELRETAEREFGQVDVLAAFAGFDQGQGALAEVTEENWHAVIDGNLTATFLTVQAFLPAMMARGGGSIITMASTAGRLPGRASIPYSAAKAGVLMFTRRVALDAGARDVRVNAIAPSAILTERQEQRIPEQMREQVAKQFPIARWGTPQDCANAALFLASSASGWVTGQTIDVAGGKVML
ncbi:short-chain dehydrogenase [Actinophytocola xinjiangensis]|uniref:Short-chain dehydrogenase n=1 Tax=Actinophytocola xinjiangensis TaxID=485602 RepID=A0A7Z0WF48_9PSEU|nr:SDR family NAD(P)-dependent oxidoreductase [Actinophytocola xinjiangensis]OLF05855.1 short-chain dehydrogenase [Actinophytocola xinjiangensis]